ncbi:hypothetical protein ACFQX6_37580 [Streptosporangium lutulentum]
MSDDDGSRSSRRGRARAALAMPHVTVEYGTGDNPVYQVGGKSFVFFRTPRPDAASPDTGERYVDVIVFWVESEADKQALVQDERRGSSPPRTSTVTRRCCCGPVGSVSSPGTSWPRWSRTRGCPAHRRAERQPGSAHVTRHDHTSPPCPAYGRREDRGRRGHVRWDAHACSGAWMKR